MPGSGGELMAFQVGDIVVDSYSKATSVKRKTYKVIGVESSGYSSKYWLISPTGKKKLTSFQYKYVTLSRYKDILSNRLTIAIKNTERAEEREKYCKEDIDTFQKEESNISNYFPRI
jgi:hypothetical protein